MYVVLVSLQLGMFEGSDVLSCNVSWTHRQNADGKPIRDGVIHTSLVLFVAELTLLPTIPTPMRWWLPEYYQSDVSDSERP